MKAIYLQFKSLFFSQPLLIDLSTSSKLIMVSLIDKILLLNFSLPNFVFFSKNSILIFSFLANLVSILIISSLIKFKKITQLQYLLLPK